MTPIGPFGRIVFAGTALLGLLATNASAGIIVQPNSAYTSATTLIPIVIPDFSTTSSLGNGTLTVGFSSVVTAGTVPSGGWFIWGSPPNTESSTPRVVADTVDTAINLTLSSPVFTFGFELEPNNNGLFNVQVQFLHGLTVLDTDTLSVNGSGGALLFAATESTAINNVTISLPAGSGGFAMAQFRYSTSQNAVPEPAALALFPAGLAAIALLHRRRRG